MEIDKDTSRPKLPVLAQSNSTPNKESLMEMETGLFRKYSALKSDGEIPKIIGIDPGKYYMVCIHT